ncbi:hypothetical protein F511_14577 [Dorcoceras hygrometricum]|uniref:Uncharacterized protein n=1 Tax=Dorcoceras hygrometricum TaxID=472368 RepID=A0A2Z7ANN2_9LAMI|nr:hypothetical protein F511_14577 [Dorcoceras hygrometricum]
MKINRGKRGRYPMSTVLNVEDGIIQNSVEEYLVVVTSAINLDILHEFVLNVVLKVHRIQGWKGKCPLYIHFNPRISSRVDKEEAKQ